MCVTPYIVQTPQGLVPVPCGKCYQCLTQWTKDWRFRLNAEKANSVCSMYLTLTYNPENLPVAYNDEVGEWQSYLVKSDLQKFFKRLRKNCPDLKFRYFAIGEYGGDYNRCHMHVVFFFSSFPFKSKNHFKNYIDYNWRKGFTYLKWTEDRHINYVSGYFNKVDKSSHITPPFKVMSKSLGLCFLTQKRIEYFFRTFKPALPNPYGKGWVKLPRYYRKKLDEWTSRIEPDNYGYVWSDIVRSFPFEPKGLNLEFSKFCNNYDSIFEKYRRDELSLLRKGVISCLELQGVVSPMKVFNLWYRDNPLLLDARKIDIELLKDALVKHKYTRLNQQDYG